MSASMRHSGGYERGNILTEYLIVLIALAAIWFTSDVVLNAVNTYYGGFSAVITTPVSNSGNEDE